MTSITNLPSESQIMAQLRVAAFPKGIKCPKCRRRYHYKVEERYMCKKCRYKFSLKTALGFKGARLSWQKLWVVLFCWQKELSFEDAQNITGLSAPTIRRWYRRFAGLLPDITNQLAGIVEMDEAYVGRRRHDNQRIILGAYERGSGKIMLQISLNREQGSLDRFILKHIELGSLIHTDAYSGYENLTEFFGYGHEVVNHSENRFGPTNHIENVWMRLKRFIKKVYHHVWKEHLPRILREFQARISHPEAFTSPLNFLSYVFQKS